MKALRVQHPRLMSTYTTLPLLKKILGEILNA